MSVLAAVQFINMYGSFFFFFFLPPEGGRGDFPTVTKAVDFKKQQLSKPDKSPVSRVKRGLRLTSRSAQLGIR